MPRVLLHAALGSMLVLAALLVACGGDDDASPDDGPGDGIASEVPGEPTATATPAPASTPDATSTPEGTLPPVVAPSPTNGGGAVDPLGSPAADEPPRGAASAGGLTVGLGLGSYCWTAPGAPGLCADAVGVITEPGSLAVPAGGSIALSGPLLGTAVESATASAWPRPASPVASGSDWVAWTPSFSAVESLAVDLVAGRLAAPAGPGTYLVAVGVSFAQGDASYGLLLDVGAGGEVEARGPVYVESAELLLLESFPVQLRLLVTGQLPTPCSEPRWKANDDGTTIAVTLWSISDPATSCIQVLEPLELSIPLGTLDAGHGTVTLNGELVGSTAPGG